ncbi:MAG TPA: DUF2079 domain-containing protein [Spirochaetota bacterium]|nr:DUF2079 domain-containing protein [Spirochaetota bacterium]HNT11673.1 DUF2079 domain-containing protein [Spirochaetota bacterium]
MNRTISRKLPLIIFTAAGVSGFTFLAAAGYRVYECFGFSSDGFHYYSTLRNMVNGLGFREGPVFEYLLGVHAYLSLYALAPLVALFRTPFVLLAVNIAMRFAAAGALFLYADRVLRPVPHGTRYAMAFSATYFFSHAVYSEMFIDVLFPPDVMLPVLMFLLAYAYDAGRKPLFFAVSLLILITKEEYLPLYPVLVAWLMALGYAAHGRIKPFLSRIQTASLAVLFCSGALLSLAVLFYFRGLNTFGYGTGLDIQAAKLIDIGAWREAPGLALRFLLPALPVIATALFFPVGARRTAIPLAFIASFILGRFAENILIYHTAKGNPWANYVIPPAIFINTVLLFSFIASTAGTRLRRRACAAVVILGLVFAVADARSSTTTKRIRAPWGSRDPGGCTMLRNELAEIRKAIPDAGTRYGYCIITDFFQHPFMDRSHVTTSFLRLSWKDRHRVAWEEWIRNADYCIFSKDDDTAAIRSAMADSHAVLVETGNFTCYRNRRQPAAPRRGEKKLLDR